MARRTAAVLALVAGALLVLANVRGGSLLLEVGDQLARAWLPPDLAGPAHLLFTALLFIAGLGGLAVLLGGALYLRRWRRTGSLLVGLGAGVGILGLLVLAGVSLASGRAAGLLGWLLGPAGVGVLLGILARRAARDGA